MNQNKPQDLWVHGVSGKMGNVLKSIILKNKSFHFIGGSSSKMPIDEKMDSIANDTMIIDFSNLDGNRSLLQSLQNTKNKVKSILICTTGHETKDIESWQEYAQRTSTKILFASNTSLGIILLLKTSLSIAGICVENDFDIEIEETHHKYKKDSPSGTALLLANQLAKTTDKKIVNHHSSLRENSSIGVHSVRGGGVFGEHKIRFISDEEEISLNHRAFSRDLFAKGALHLCKWLKDQSNHGVYFLKDVIHE